MLKIRLSRFGTKNAPTFRLIISDSHKDTKGTALEYLGHYNPRSKDKTISLKTDRIKYWLSKGAQMSPSVNNLLLLNKVIDGKKVKSFAIPMKKKKEAEKKKADAEKAKVDAAAKTAETKTEEPKVEEKPAE